MLRVRSTDARMTQAEICYAININFIHQLKQLIIRPIKSGVAISLTTYRIVFK